MKGSKRLRALVGEPLHVLELAAPSQPNSPQNSIRLSVLRFVTAVSFSLYIFKRNFVEVQ